MKDKRMFALLGISIFLIVIIGIFRPREIDWTPTFKAADKIPYGSYIFYHSLPQLFSDKKVTINKKQPYEINYTAHHKQSYCFVQPEFYPSETNVEALLQLANDGNDVFVSSTLISGPLADTLRLKQYVNLQYSKALRILDKDTVSCVNSNFTNPQLKADSGYWYKGSIINYYYYVEDTAFLSQGFLTNSPAKEVTVLGTDADGKPNFISIHFGAGNILLHNNPYTFSNYYMLNAQNAEYAAKCVSYLQGSEIVWDEYFKKGDENSDQASLRFILTQGPLRWAYYSLLVSLLLYVLFNIKRRQRVIPVSDPYNNTSVEFARLVGALYYNQSDHKNIMIKKINYLLEFIRNRYNLDTTEINSEFCNKLSAKSGIEAERISYLFNLIQGVQRKILLSKQELTDLNTAIQYFKTHCQ